METGVDSRLCFIILASFFSKARMKVNEHNIHLPFQVIIEEIEPQNCHADTCTKVSKSLSFGSNRYYFRREKR